MVHGLHIRYHADTLNALARSLTLTADTITVITHLYWIKNALGKETFSTTDFLKILIALASDFALRYTSYKFPDLGYLLAEYGPALTTQKDAGRWIVDSKLLAVNEVVMPCNWLASVPTSWLVLSG